MRSIFIICYIFVFLNFSESSDVNQFPANGNQHQSSNLNHEGQGRIVRYSQNEDRHLNQFDYRHLPNANQEEYQKSYGNPAPPGFKSTESIFHILFVKSRK